MAEYSYMQRVLIGFDQFCNAVAGGWPDETFSARCWRCRATWPWKALRVAVDCLFFWQSQHCRESWKSEMGRAQLPASYRKEVPNGQA